MDTDNGNTPVDESTTDKVLVKMYQVLQLH